MQTMQRPLTEGEAVATNFPAGIFGAMALGSQLTQSTLNTFHIGGDDKLVSKGVPRIQEILNNSSSVSRNVYHLGSEESQLLLDRFGSPEMIEETLLEQVCSGRLETTLQIPDWVEQWQQRFGLIAESGSKTFYLQRFCLRKMIQHGVTFRQVLLALELFGSQKDSLLLAACSPLQDDDVIEVLFQPTNSLPWAKPLSREISPAAAEEYFVHRVVLPRLHQIRVKGLEGVLRCSEEPGGKIGMITAAQVDLEDLSRVLEGARPALICDRAETMLAKFGIEVAARCLRRELQQMMPDILPCHIELIVAAMTCTGQIRPINRYTVREFANPLQRISFEESTRNLVDACIRHETDWLQSVSSSVTASKTVKK